MGKEIILKDDVFLVSETDEKGRIRFANHDFIKTVGMSLEELSGKPHNIIRHPDMPKVAFKDLWDNIKAGKVWSGFVKNLSKNGDYYWVFATVYPFESCDGKKGYMSCRKRASREEIEKAEALYKTLR